ncbi:hypothetical protein BDR07DRAFT_1489281 [Suillus spraguei]|nr:hypothetical protein BDR07DRAFT_1489281 [Suillus spraguei]
MSNSSPFASERISCHWLVQQYSASTASIITRQVSNTFLPSITPPSSESQTRRTSLTLLVVVRADYTFVSDISTVLRGNKADVLISTVTFVFGGVVAQDVLADAAKEVGVKLFVPSEFGVSPVWVMKSMLSQPMQNRLN